MDNNVNNENQRKHEKKGKNITVVLIIIIMILLLVLGIVAGMFISKNMNSDSKQNEATSSSSSKKAENDENNKEQNIKEDDENNQEKNNDEETDEKQNNNEKQDNNKEYSQADLEKMALDYYEAKTGYRPTKSGSQVNDDGTVSIQLYDNMGDHNSTSDWYTVDPKTGIGTDLLKGKIDLTTKPQKNIDNTSNNNSSNNNIAAEEIRKCLKDKNWVHNNIMMKNTVFGDPIEHEQELSFIKVNGGNYSPMIVIEAYSEQDISVQYFIVTYQNGNVISHPFSEYPFHTSHGGIMIDANNAMAVQGYMHMGYNVSTYYDIKEGKPRTLDIIGNYDDYGDDGYTGNIIYFNGDDTNKISESQYNEIAQKYKKYKFVSIGTKLTDANIDEYVK